MAKGRYKGALGTPTRAQDPPTLEELEGASYPDRVISRALEDPSADVRAFAGRAARRRPPVTLQDLGVDPMETWETMIPPQEQVQFLHEGAEEMLWPDPEWGRAQLADIAEWEKVGRMPRELEVGDRAEILAGGGRKPKRKRSAAARVRGEARDEARREMRKRKKRKKR